MWINSHNFQLDFFFFFGRKRATQETRPCYACQAKRVKRRKKHERREQSIHAGNEEKRRHAPLPAGLFLQLERTVSIPQKTEVLQQRQKKTCPFAGRIIPAGKGALSVSRKTETRSMKHGNEGTKRNMPLCRQDIPADKGALSVSRKTETRSMKHSNEGTKGNMPLPTGYHSSTEG